MQSLFIRLMRIKYVCPKQYFRSNNCRVHLDHDMHIIHLLPLNCASFLWRNVLFLCAFFATVINEVQVSDGANIEATATISTTATAMCLVYWFYWFFLPTFFCKDSLCISQYAPSVYIYFCSWKLSLVQIAFQQSVSDKLTYASISWVLITIAAFEIFHWYKSVYRPCPK